MRTAYFDIAIGNYGNGDRLSLRDLNDNETLLYKEEVHELCTALTMYEKLMDNGAEEPEIVEVCPHCDHENIQNWDVEKRGYVGRCDSCGKNMMLCDECIHAEDNKEMRCDWHMEGNFSVCFRGRYEV